MLSPDNSRNGERRLSFMPVNQSRSPPHIKKRRVPHACAWCRKRKVRCEPSSRDSVACRRCAREGRRCDFNARRTWDTSGGDDNGSIICSAARSSELGMQFASHGLPQAHCELQTRPRTSFPSLDHPTGDRSTRSPQQISPLSPVRHYETAITETKSDPTPLI